MSTLPSCLAGAGILGHLWVATLRSNGDERCFCQASYGADAVRALDEYKGSETRGEIYERVGRLKRTGEIQWRKRSRAYALLDQAPGRPYEPAATEGAT